MILVSAGPIGNWVMMRIKVHLESIHKRAIQQAVRALEAGQLIIYPTDTVYGIGCSLYQKKALEKLYQMKKKSKFEGLSLLCESIQQASRYARISNFTFRVLKRCFPGPFTIILDATREIPKLMLSRRKEVGIRIPDCPLMLELIHHLGVPIVNSSVTSLEDELLNDPDEISERFQHAIDVFLDAGPLPEASESTVLRIQDGDILVVREGKGSLDRLYL